MEEYEEKCRKLRKDAKRIWKERQVMNLKRMDFDKLLELYNKISRDFEAFEELCGECNVGCTEMMKERRRGTFDAALVKLTVAMLERYNEYKEKHPEIEGRYGSIISDIKSRFPETELAEIKDFERFAALDRENLSEDEFVDLITEKGGLNVFIKDIFERQNKYRKHLREAYLGELEVSNAVLTVITEGYERRIEILVNSLIKYLDNNKKNGNAIMRLFKDYEESILESANLRREAEKISKDMEKEGEVIESDTHMLEKEKEELEAKIAEMERRLTEEESEKKAMGMQLNMLQQERSRLENQLRDIYSKWDSKFEVLERKKKELEEQERKLETMKSAMKEKVRAEIEDEIQLLKAQINDYSKTIEKYKSLKYGLESDNQALREKIDEINAALRGESDARPVTAEEAKQYEMAFIGRFERKMSELPLELPDPLEKGKKRTIKDWGDGRLNSSSKKRVMEMSGDKWTEMPLNMRSRFVLKSFFSGKLRGIVEAVALNHLPEYAKIGIDTKKATLGELQAILVRAIESAEKGNYFHIIGIESPTGWSEKAIEFINSEEYQKNFLNRYVYVYLVDVEMNKIYYNKIYDKMIEGMRIYADIFRPQLDVENLEECKKKIWDRLREIEKEKDKYTAYITLSEAAKICRSRNTAKRAFVGLQNLRKAKMMNVKGEIVLKRKSEE